jgi:hypothetical protein
MALAAAFPENMLTADLVRFIQLEADHAEEKAKRLREQADLLAQQYGESLQGLPFPTTTTNTTTAAHTMMMAPLDERTGLPKYKGKKVEKGIAFPTCLSLNNCCGHFSPLKEDSIDLKEGDVVKMCVCSLLFFLFLLHTPQSHANSTHEHNGYNRTQGWPRRKHGKGFNTTAFANVHWRWGDGTASV